MLLDGADLVSGGGRNGEPLGVSASSRRPTASVMFSFWPHCSPFSMRVKLQSAIPMWFCGLRLLSAIASMSGRSTKRSPNSVRHRSRAGPAAETGNTAASILDRTVATLTPASPSCRPVVTVVPHTTIGTAMPRRDRSFER